MKKALYAISAVWFLIVLACGAPHRRAVRGESSSAESQELWERCSTAVMAMQCGPDQDPIYRGICGRRLADRYFEGASLAERREFLIRNGCPPPMVH